jgi:hypothetical protein
MTDDVRAKFSREWAHALLKRVTLEGEGEFRPMVMGRFGDAPGNRAIVGHTHNQPALTGENGRPAIRCVRHEVKNCL